jgi:peptidoglycan/LPS O-acetylase OafA/YrhL
MGIMVHMSVDAPNPPKANRLAFIDALRGFACLWVIAVHAHGAWVSDPDDVAKLSWQYPLLSFWGLGMKGVDLFIVLSGFCLSWPVFRPDGYVDVSRVGKSFFLRRFWRIVPVYYAALLFAVLLLNSTLPRFAPYTGLLDVVPSLLGIQNVLTGYAGRVNGSLWSIAMELQLYVFFPIVIRLIARFRIQIVCLVLFALGLVSGVLDAYIDAPNVIGYFSLLGRIGQFAAGVYVAWLVRNNRFPGSLLTMSLALFGLVLGLLAHINRGGPVVHGLTFTCFAVFFACSMLVLARLRNQTWTNNPVGLALCKVGLISYSVYVVHFPIVYLLAPLKYLFGTTPMSQMASFFVTGFPTILIVGCAMYLLVERWSMLRASLIR